MLKVFNILLLVSMASMCRALANWQKFLTFSAVSIHLTPEGNVLVSGESFKHDFEFAIFNTEGGLLEQHLVNNMNFSTIQQVIPTHDSHNLLVMGDSVETRDLAGKKLFLAEISSKGAKLWQNTYFTYQEANDYSLTKIKDGYMAIIIHGRIKLSLYNYQLFKISHNGAMLWEKELYIISNQKSCTLISREKDPILILRWPKTVIIQLDSEGNLKQITEADLIELETAIGTKDGGIVMVGKYKYNPAICKTSQNGTMIWRTVIEDSYTESSLVAITEIYNGGYIIGGLTNGVKGSDWLVKLLPNGTEKWHRMFSFHTGILKILEAEPNVYYMLQGKPNQSTFGAIMKYSVPSYAEGLHCAEKEQCGSCGLGFYWNYTSCVPCSVGCVECLDIDHCINCSSRYAKTEDNRCIPVEEPCNCDLPNLTPECREKCALPVCSSNSSLPFTYKTDNKKVCTCPDEMLSNETHCLPKTDVGCHPLCDICAGEYCLQCKNITGIFVSRTHSIAVKCQCDYGYQFNSTACIPVKRIHNVQSSESLVAIALGIIGGLVAVGSVAFIMYLKYRRDEWMHGENLPDIQTGKEQHTVEVSKEMEVHAITRDDERTGEIMFKRE
eukprot:TRINITY_DN165_c0_g1_i5.p1 TRINITY_DN165_c0_g1~~TRINITY_DN165_c0_g1_i5.p1  ORF type:complete len:643 (+),score=33.65 TRINITY_DN165_c0_g1_i5:98-1930(+)